MVAQGQSEMKKEDDDALVPEGQIFPENACGSCNIKEATHGCRACGVSPLPWTHPVCVYLRAAHVLD